MFNLLELMASLTLTSEQDRTIEEPDFETDIANVGNEIEAYFSCLIDAFANRRNQLLSELDAILALYLEEKRIKEARMQELEGMLRYHEDKYLSSNLKELQDNVLNQIRNELSAIPNELKKNISFKCDEKFVTEVSGLGILHISDSSPLTHQANMEYVTSTEGNFIEPHLNSPNAPALEENRPSAFNPTFVNQTSPDTAPVEGRGWSVDDPVESAGSRSLFLPLFK